MSPRDIDYGDLMQILVEPHTIISNNIQQEIQTVEEFEQEQIQEQIHQQQILKLQQQQLEIEEQIRKNEEEIQKHRLLEQKYRNEAEEHRLLEQKYRNEILKIDKKIKIMKWNNKILGYIPYFIYGIGFAIIATKYFSK